MNLQGASSSSAVLALAVLALSVGPAAAQKAKPVAQITVSNMRSVVLTTLEIATTGDQPRLVAKLAKPLAPGKSAILKLNKPSGCNYFVLARFDDAVESDGDSVDLCRDKVLRLTE